MAKKADKLVAAAGDNSRIIDAKSLKKIEKERNSWKKDWMQNKTMYLIFLPILVYFFLLHYLPMFGLAIAFEDFSIAKGVFGSKWVGFDNFAALFAGEEFLNALKNTVIIGLFNLVLGFPAPIVFAVIITNIRFKRLRRGIQTVSYMPNFVAPVVIATFIITFCAKDGVITQLLTLFGVEEQNLLANSNPPVFWLIYAFSGVWQSFGYGAIPYVAALSNINGDMYEAAALDGASKWKMVWKISIPNILPMIIMMLTVQVGITFRAGFDRILLLYMPETYNVADVLFTYTYRNAFGVYPDYGLSAASGLFQSIVGTIMLFGSNWLSKKAAKTSLF